MIKLGIVVTAALNIKEVCTTRKNILEPGNLYFEIGYAHIEAMIIIPAVPTAVINAVLNIYLLNGTQELDIKVNKSLKFLRVGLFTKNSGGNSHNSFIGLSEVDIVYIKGSSITMPTIIKNRTNNTSPQIDLAIFFLKTVLITDINYSPTPFSNL